MQMKMKNWLLLLPMVSMLGCLKESKYECKAEEVTVKAPDTEIDALRTFLTDNSITATDVPGGFFYTLNTTGTGAQPNVCSYVSVNYTLKLLDGTVVEHADNAEFFLSGLILGWQEAIPLMKAGGNITLYLPPSLAYGDVAMIFEINLNGIQ